VLLILLLIIRNSEVFENYPDKNKDKNEKTCIRIDVAIPADRNVTQKEAERKIKYKNYNKCGT
jgi:hypothetical protein